MNTIDINLLQVFCAVAELKSFAAAASSLSLSTASVSRKIKQLESIAGQALLFRSTRTVTLTSFGERLYMQASPLMLQLSHSLQAVREDDRALEATVRLTAPEDFGATVLAPILGAFSTQWPRIHIECIFTDRRLDFVSESIDVGIRMGAPGTDELVARKIGETMFDFVVSPRYLANIESVITDDNLADHVLAAFGKHDNQAPFKFNKNFSPKISSRSFVSIYNLIKAGYGASFLPRFLIDEDCRNGSLLRICPSMSPKPTPAYLISAQKHRTSPATKKLLEFLQEELPGFLNCSERHEVLNNKGKNHFRKLRDKDQISL